MKKYLLPLKEIRDEMMVINSRFIAILTPIQDTEEARAFLHRMRDEFPDATHHVMAYILGGGNTIMEYCSDDGEPAGTAGKPILTVLRGSGMGDLAVIVVRYFGGTKLGTGGLVKAYTEAAQLVCNAVPRARQVLTETLLLALPYNLLERLRILTRNHAGQVLDEDFAVDVTMTLRFPQDQVAAFQLALRELSAGSLQAESMESGEMLVEAT